MYDLYVLKELIRYQCLPIMDADLPHISNTLQTIDMAEAALDAFPHLHEEVPLLIVDKETFR